MSSSSSLQRHPAASLWPPGHPRALEYEGYGEEYGEGEEEYHSAVDDAEIAHGVRASRRSSNGTGGGFGKKGTADGGGDDSKGEGSSEDDLYLSEPEPTQLPESTHTLFFTQPLCSVPTFYATGIVVVSIMCLAMALINNLEDRTADNPLNVPVNVTSAVRIAQYLSIIIALLMEEEIPTGLHLLRTIPKSAFEARFPSRSYGKFVLAALLRIAMGYIFLGNVFIILAQANDVIGIFYDVLALQFIQQLDDIAFTLGKMLMEEEIPTGLHLLRTIPKSAFEARFPSRSYGKFVVAALLRIAMGYIFLGNVFIILAQANDVIGIFYDVLALQFIQQLDDIAFTLGKMDILGKRLHRACTARLFQTEFEKQKFRRSLTASLLLKSVYFVNLGLFLFGMIQISLNQENGYYQCNEITVDFGDEVWEDALVKTATGGYETKVLVFSTFNGVYKKNGTRAGRPLYKEMGKVDSEPFHPDFITPAEISYDTELGSWVFSHPAISKSKTEDSPWLLRSGETTEYDLLQVDGDWNIWVSKISLTQLTYTCNYCSERSDCNLNGECSADGHCICDSGGEDLYIGTHCEVKLKEECGIIKDEIQNQTYSIQYFQDPNSGADAIFQEYNRPVYSLVEGKANFTEGDIDWLVFTGRRWIYIGFNPIEMNLTFEEVVAATWNYHAFWADEFSFSSPGLLFLSDPTTGDNPVGVDWFLIGERGSQFGPFGALYPLQKDGQIGRGLFRCAGPRWLPPTNATAE